MKLILRIYDYISQHTKLLWASLVAFIVLAVFLVININYSEDISDFLPLGSSDQEALSVYQNISGASRIYFLFSNPDDADLTVEAIDHFTETVHHRDTAGWCNGLTTQFDMSQIMEVTDFVYDNIPYFLTSEDYERIDSLLSQPGYIDSQMKRNLEALMFPTSGLMTSNIIRDPLSLFSPVLSRLQTSNNQMVFEMYDGYIFTPDMSRAVAMMDSPFGNSETEYNSKMLNILHESIDIMKEDYPNVDVNIVGGPEIAVGNANRIKKDSIIAIALSAVLIVLLVVYSIGSIRNILLIFLSIGWGWLFALGGISLLGNQVSIIVIGISSVILGIAVNYPLHLIVHLNHVPDMRTAIKEIMAPLVIGNITTVSAFLTLIPLQSVALRDLGLFASLLLVGTIIFVLIYLPHMLKVKPTSEHKSKLLNRLSQISPEKSKFFVLGTIILTALLSVYSFRTEFDSNMANINYMTDGQREDMKYFQDLLSDSTTGTAQTIYVLSSGKSYDEALEKNETIVPVLDSLVQEGVIHGYNGVSKFLTSKSEQIRRLNEWNSFTAKHETTLTKTLTESAIRNGFSSKAFSQFTELIEYGKELNPQEITYFTPLTEFILSQNVTTVNDTGLSYIVNTISVEPEVMQEVKSKFDNCFDVVSMNSALSNNLSDNFNYIGWACSLIVFFFLWFSFGRLELAIISFLPMAVSWIWILGIMAILGIKFNIVNIILATFIFGQGDDYTIFMTEGCQHEYTYRRPILASYKNSILQSALIMFVGIGTLIVSKHPAMKSLAEVTIIGMFSVVLMAYMIPPLMFKLLTTKNGTLRKHPVTLTTLIKGYPSDNVGQVRGRYIYKGKIIMRTVNRNLKDISNQTELLSVEGKTSMTHIDPGYGEQSLLIALENPNIHVKAIIADDEKRRIAEIAAMDFVNNIEFLKQL